MLLVTSLLLVALYLTANDDDYPPSGGATK